MDKNSRGVFFGILLILLVGTCVYSNSFSGVFLLDDFDGILKNTRINSLAWPWDFLKETRRPFLFLTFALNYAAGGIHVTGYHVVNLAIHLLAGLVLFGLVRRSCSLSIFPEPLAKDSLVLATVIVLIWVVHPLQTESVTYVIQRAESLMGLFYLLTLYGALRFMTSQKIQWAIMSGCACLLGGLTKEVAVTAPFVVLLYDRAFMAPSFGRALRERKVLYAFLSLAWLAMGYLFFQNTQGNPFLINTKPSLTPIQYALSQPEIIFHYLKQAFVPHPLVLYYGWPPVTNFEQAFPFLMIIAFLVALSVWAFRFYPPTGFLGLTFFLILMPTSSFFVIHDLAFEHRMYLPLAPVVILAVLFTRAVLQRTIPSLRWRRLVALAMTATIVTLLGLATLHRNGDYKDEVSMWENVIAARPQNVNVLNDLGLAMIRVGRLEEARYYLNQVLELRPVFPKAYNNLGLIELNQGKPQEAERFFAMAVEMDPDSPEANNNFGLAFARQGKTEKAFELFTRAMDLNPEYAEPYNNTGALLIGQGRYYEAKEYCLKAVGLKPHYPEAYNNLGVISIYLNQLEEAKGFYEKALNLRPRYAKALNNLGVVHKRQGDFLKAKDIFLKAVVLDPGYKEAQLNLQEINTALSSIKDWLKEKN